VQCQEVQELIPAYVLGALEPHDRERVELHAASCPLCAAELRTSLDTTAHLAALLPSTGEPSLGLRSRVLRSLPSQKAAPRARRAGRVLDLLKWTTPAAAAVAVLAMAGLLVTNLTLHARVGNMEQEAERLATLESLMDQESAMLANLELRQNELLSMVQQQRLLAYWLAIPGTEVAPVEPTSGSKGYGMLISRPDSSVAILVVSGLPVLPDNQSYYVWLTRDGERNYGGVLRPDSSGWVLAPVRASGRVLDFEGLWVTADSSPTGAATTVLKASLRR